MSGDKKIKTIAHASGATAKALTPTTVGTRSAPAQPPSRHPATAPAPLPTRRGHALSTAFWGAEVGLEGAAVAGAVDADAAAELAESESGGLSAMPWSVVPLAGSDGAEDDSGWLTAMPCSTVPLAGSDGDVDCAAADVLARVQASSSHAQSVLGGMRAMMNLSAALVGTMK
ncbi:MAG: hypothetical protein ABIJ09_13175 [Pseudomonadota bacterium]